MNQENKLLIHAGPYKLDLATSNVACIRGKGHALIAKCAPGIYNRKDITHISLKQAEAHASIMLEALQVFALTGKTPMEMHVTLAKLYQ
jgi:hypothetical protein